jgi:predicted MFS family arabinose efflux permease
LPSGVDGAVHAPHPTGPGGPAAAETRAPRPWLVLLTVCLGYFTASSAMAPTASILPSISAGLDLSVQEAGWVMSAYFLTLVGMVLVMGRLGDLMGQARVFGLGALVFTFGELLCGLSPSFAVLLVGRGTQGVGSAMIFGTSLAVIASAIPPRLRGRAIGLLTMSSACASLLGVGISTWSVESLSWQWAFLIPLPIGLAAS